MIPANLVMNDVAIIGGQVLEQQDGEQACVAPPTTETVGRFLIKGLTSDDLAALAAKWQQLTRLRREHYLCSVDSPRRLLAAA